MDRIATSATQASAAASPVLTGISNTNFVPRARRSMCSCARVCLANAFTTRKLTIAACEADPDGTVIAAGICMLRRIGNQLRHDKGKTNGLVRVEHKRPRALKVNIAIGCDVVKVTANVR
jgi:hypothetical protein